MSSARDEALTPKGPGIARWLAAALIGLLLSGCGDAGSARPLEAEVPRRIVSLLPSNTEILYALGLGDRVVGVSAFDDYPPEVEEKERVGDYFNPNLEKIVALKPDLVLTQASARIENLERTLGRYGIRVLALKNERLSELLDAFEAIGEATGTKERARALVDETRARLDAVRRRYEELARVRVLFILDVHPLYVVGRDSYLNDLLEAAGGENVAGRFSGAYPHLSPEVLFELEPEVILNASPAAEATDFFEPFRKLRAVSMGRVHRFDSAVVMRPGPRVFEALEEIARRLHPEEPPPAAPDAR